MTDSYYHGIELVEIDDGIRPMLRLPLGIAPLQPPARSYHCTPGRPRRGRWGGSDCAQS